MNDPIAIDAVMIKEQADERQVVERSLRWLADGATTLSEVIVRIREYADYLAELNLKGWELIDEVDNLYMIMQNPAYPIGHPEYESHE